VPQKCHLLLEWLLRRNQILIRKALKDKEIGFCFVLSLETNTGKQNKKGFVIKKKLKFYNLFHFVRLSCFGKFV